MDKTRIDQLPQTPGVYLFKDQKDKVIYVGKALNIKSRVQSHFSKAPKTFYFKTSLLRQKAATVDYIVVQSEIEALLLEANLIKRHQPRYNTRLKDGKSYLYIKITTGDSFPKVQTARRELQLPLGATSFGPFPSAKTVRTTLKSLRRIFPYCNCNFKTCSKRKSCFYVEIGLDAGPCLGLISAKEYGKIIHHLILLLAGKREELLKELKKAMEEAAKAEEFEKAQGFKKQIEGVEYLTRRVTAPQIYLEDPEFLIKKRQEGLWELKKLLSLAKVPGRIEGYDISDLHGREATGSMVVFQKGEADKSQYRRFKIRAEGRPNDVGMMREVLRRRLGHQEWPQANLIVVDGGKGQVSGAKEALNEVKSASPVIGLAKRIEEIIVPRSKAHPKAPKFTSFSLPADSPALHLLQAIRDEAHRFTLTYHRKLRIKGLLVNKKAGTSGR